jgi:hypothetical protein
MGGLEGVVPLDTDSDVWQRPFFGCLIGHERGDGSWLTFLLIFG